MRRALFCLSVFLGCVVVLDAQPIPDRRDSQKISPNDALVINPIGPWRLVSPYQSWKPDPTERRPGAALHTNVSGMEQKDGWVRIAVADADFQAEWTRHLPFEIDTDRYPIVILTYRASGILPSEEPLLKLDSGRDPLVALTNRDLIADGKIREALMDLRELAGRTRARSITLLPHCGGPEPATLDVLALSFESDGGLPPLEQPEDKELTVRVVDTHGQAVPGATVTVDPDLLNVSRTAKTDAKGRVTLRARGGYAQRLRVLKDGMATAACDATAAGDLPDSVTLRRGAPYSGTVRDEDGRPVPFAAVEVRVPPLNPTPFGRHDRVVTILTDERGEWRTPVLPAESAVSLYPPTARAFHAGYERMAPVALPSPDGPGRRNIELVLPAIVPLAGRVVGPGGQPVTDAFVGLWPARRSTEEKAKQTRTDGDGRFVFARPGRGGHSLLVQSGGFAPQAFPVFIKPGIADIAIRLQQGKAIRGRVVTPGGTPLPGIRVKAMSWRSLRADYWHATTDAQGRFVWHNAPDGYIGFHISGPERAGHSGYPLKASDEEQTIVLADALRLHGSITDAVTGKPIPHCLISFGKGYRADDPAEQNPPYWGTGMDPATGGTYELRFEEFGNRQLLGLRFEGVQGYVPETVFPIEIGAGGARQLDIRLQPEPHPTLWLTIRQPDGRPAVGAKVCFLELRQQLGIGTSGKDEQLGVSMYGDNPGVTDAEGRYRLGLHPKANWLIVSHPTGYLEVAAQRARALLVLQLQPWGTVEGVCRSGSKPAAGRELHLRPDREGSPADSPRVDYWFSAVTDEKGRYAFHRAPPGTGHVYDGFVDGLVGVEKPRRGAAYRVAAGGTARVIIGGTGRHVLGRLALPKGVVQTVGWDRGRGSLTDGKTTYHFAVQQDGTFRIEDVSAGDWRLEVKLWSTLSHVSGPDRWGWALLGSITQSFTIPKMPTGRSGEPLGLGTLVLTMEN
jgi:protocatechuate 3,4-dioxygenase beta subunit